ILDDGNNFFNANQHTLPDGSPARDGHVIVAGLGGNDFIVGGLGDDYIYGDAGNDTLQGSQGNDNIFGGDAAAITLAENVAAVTTVHATDANNVVGDPLNPQTLNYTISAAAVAANADASLFTINSTTGELSFITAPNFEAAGDNGGNNVYNVVVQVSDGMSIDTQALSIAITNADEARTGSLNISGGTATSTTVTLNSTNTLADPDATTGIGVTWYNGVTPVGVASTFSVLAGSVVQTVTLGTSYNQSSPLPNVSVTAPETAIIGRTGTADAITGTAGRDLIFGMSGNDTITGGAGNDAIDGGAGSDRANYAGLANLTFDVSGTTILVTDTTGAEGSDSLINVETLGLGASTYAVVAPSASYAGANGSQFVRGTSGNDSLNGGAGNDIIVAGGGDDTLRYNVNNGAGTANGGRDVIDGGAGGTDTFVLTGNAAVETFRIYSATEWLNLGAGHTLANASSGIVITRNGTADTNVIAELRNVEEIQINGNTQVGSMTDGFTGLGATSTDTVAVIGNFVGTGLAYNTITVNGGSTVDITALTSDHRVVLNGTGSAIVGDARPQDVVNGAASAAPSDAFVLPSTLSGSITHDADFGLGLRDLNLWGGADLGNT
ncbi:MAG: hypothetical protein ABL931_22740, partial [Usitatibacteraceae bacterium]